MFLNHRKCQKAHSGIVSSRQGLGQARTLARRLYKKTPSLVCSTRDDVNRGTTLFQSILSALRSHCVKYCYTNIRLNAQTAFRRKSHSGTITYTTPSQPTHHLPFYIRGNGFSCTAGQTSFQCEAPGCIHRFVSRASHQPAAFCHHVHLLLLPFKAYII